MGRITEISNLPLKSKEETIHQNLEEIYEKGKEHLNLITGPSTIINFKQYNI